MELADDLFVAENVEDLEQIVYALRRGIPMFRLHCVVWMEARNRVEIISSYELFTEKNKNKAGKIIGVAMGHGAAAELLRTVVEEAHKDGKDLANPKEWL